MIALLLGLSGVAQAQGCPDLGATLREVSAAIDDVRLEDAQSLSQQAREGLECQTEVVKSLTLLGLYQSAGAVAYFLGNFNEADEAFARAIAVAPASRLDPAYGEAPASIYENLREATMSTGGASLTGPEAVQAWVDGRPLSPDYPLDVPPGFHLVQVESSGGQLVNTVRRMAPGEKLVVTSEGTLSVFRQERVSEEPPSPEPLSAVAAAGPTPGEPTRGRRRTGLLVVGGLGVAAGAAGLVLASFSHEQFFEATDVDDLDVVRLRTNALAAGGIGLAAVGAGMLGVGVIPRQAGAEVIFTWRF